MPAVEDLLVAAPAGSIPFLFASLKVSIAISLIGAIVGELPTGAQAGLGAWLLIGDQFGNPVQSWAALFAAAAVAALLLVMIGLIERFSLWMMGARP